MRTLLSFLALAFIALPAAAQIDFFSPFAGYETGDSDHLVVADFNGDGNPDILESKNNSSAATVFLGDGTGGFAVSASLDAGGARFKPVGIGDFDRDGHLDAVVLSRGNIYMFPGLGDGTFFSPMVTTFSDEDFTAVAVADINNDTRLDLAVMRDDFPGMSVYLGNGIGEFQFVSRMGSGIARYLALADYNEDGNIDAVYTGGAGVMLLGDGTGDFTESFSWEGDCVAFTGGDFDDDGHEDIAFINDFGDNVVYWYGNGDGSVTSVLGESIDDASTMVCADFDSDGHNDFLVTNFNTNVVHCVRGLGNREFIHLPLTRPTGGDEPRVMACADFDRDGEIDIVIGHNGHHSRDDMTIVLNGSKHNEGCALGRVNMALDYCVDVLYVNDSSGNDAQRRVVLHKDDPITITMSTPPSVGDGEGYFVLYGWIGIPDESTTRVTPFGMGIACMPVPISRPFDLKPTGYWNNTTLMSESGHRLDVPPKNPRPSIPAPSIVERRPSGVGEAAYGFLQGFIFDPNSAGEELGSVTNGIELIIIE